MNSTELLREILNEVKSGSISINEARGRLGLEPIEGGDHRLIIKDGLVVGIIDDDGNRRSIVDE